MEILYILLVLLVITKIFGEIAVRFGQPALVGELLSGITLGQTKLDAGDTVIMYGPRDVLVDLDERRAGSTGNWDHHKAVDKQRQVEAEEQELKEKLEATRAASA